MLWDILRRRRRKKKEGGRRGERGRGVGGRGEEGDGRGVGGRGEEGDANDDGSVTAAANAFYKGGGTKAVL